MKPIEALKYGAKAAFAGASVFVGSVTVVLVGEGDNASLADISDGQWFTIAGFTITAIGGVFGLTNGPKSGE